MPDSGTTSGDAILTVGLRLRSPGLPINRSCSNLHDFIPVGARRVSQMRQDAWETADERGCTRRAILHRQAMQMQYHGRSRIVIPYLVTAGRVWGDGRAMRQTDGRGGVIGWCHRRMGRMRSSRLPSSSRSLPSVLRLLQVLHRGMLGYAGTPRFALCHGGVQPSSLEAARSSATSAA